MKEGYTIIKDIKGGVHEAPMIPAHYLKNLLDRQVEVSFADSKCIGVFEGEDENFISL